MKKKPEFIKEIILRVIREETYKSPFDPQNKRPIKFRIFTKDRKIKFAGTGQDSWFTLEKALKLVDKSKGEMIYEVDPSGNPVWEVM